MKNKKQQILAISAITKKIDILILHYIRNTLQIMFMFEIKIF